jgi:plastocyanin
MNPTRLTRFVLPLAAVLVLACGGAGAGWTFAPLGPTAAPTVAPTPSAAAEPDVTLEVQTTEANSLAFEPNSLDAPASKIALVNYLNDSSLQHNIVFLDSADATGAVLGETEIATGPDNTQSTTFTTPATAGDYYFYCLVHGAAMSGTLHVAAQ